MAIAHRLRYKLKNTNEESGNTTWRYSDYKGGTSKEQMKKVLIATLKKIQTQASDDRTRQHAHRISIGKIR